MKINMKKLFFRLLIFLSYCTGGLAASFECGTPSLENGQTLDSFKYSLEMTPFNVSVIVQRFGQFPSTSSISAFPVGQQEVGGVFKSRGGEVSVYVDPSISDSVKIQVLYFGLRANASCVLSARQSFAARVYEVLQSDEIKKLSQALISDLNKLGRTSFIKSLNECSRNSSIYGGMKYPHPKATMMDASSAEFLNYVVALEEIESAICELYRNFFEASVFYKWNQDDAFNVGLAKCQEIVSNPGQYDHQFVKQATSQYGKLLKSTNPIEFNRLLEIKEAAVKMNRLLCEKILSISSLE